MTLKTTTSIDFNLHTPPTPSTGLQRSGAPDKQSDWAVA